MLISGSNIYQYLRQTHLSDRSTLYWLGTPVGKPYSALSLLLSCETLELFDFLCRRWCEQDYQHHFLKKTFLHGEVDMLSFNILTIFALSLYVSCGLAMASKNKVNIFFILYISCKKHFSKGTTFQTHCWTGIYWEVNV